MGHFIHPTIHWIVHLERMAKLVNESKRERERASALHLMKNKMKNEEREALAIVVFKQQRKMQKGTQNAHPSQTQSTWLCFHARVAQNHCNQR
jgi:hypothetical protein